MQSGKVLPGPKTTFPKPFKLLQCNISFLIHIQEASFGLILLKVVVCHKLTISRNVSFCGVSCSLAVCLTHNDTFLSNDKRGPPFSRPVKELDFVFVDF